VRVERDGRAYFMITAGFQLWTIIQRCTYPEKVWAAVSTRSEMSCEVILGTSSAIFAFDHNIRVIGDRYAPLVNQEKCGDDMECAESAWIAHKKPLRPVSFFNAAGNLY
jgi:hypothetical protein